MAGLILAIRLILSHLISFITRMTHGFTLFSSYDHSWVGIEKCSDPEAQAEKRWGRTSEEEGGLRNPRENQYPVSRIWMAELIEHLRAMTSLHDVSFKHV